MAYEVEVVELDPQPAMVIESTVPPQELGAALGRMLPAVYGYVTGNGGTLAGRPFLRYLAMTDRFTIQAGLPVAEPMPGTDEIIGIELPGGRAATILYLGPYDGVGAAWTAMTSWCSEQGIGQIYGGWDSYENDPTEVADPSEIRTRLYLPLS